jgi:hypothetical protein
MLRHRGNRTMKGLTCIFLCAAVMTLAQSQDSPSQESGAGKDAKPAQKATDAKKTIPSSEGKKPEPIKAQGKQEESKPDPNFELNRKMADFTERVADYTAYLFWATFALGVVGIAQAFTLAKQFVTANRPRMSMRWFRLHPPKGDAPLSVEFIVANDGFTDAKIGDHNFSVLILENAELAEVEKGSFPPYLKGPPILRKVFTARKRLSQKARVNGLKDEKAAFEGVMAGTAKLVCCGYIRYTDRMLGRYESRFFKAYIPRTDEFIPSANPDHDNTAQEGRSSA